MANTVLKSANSRVFLLEGRAGPNTAPSYQSCMRLNGISQGFGDIESVECPDPYNYGKFVEVAQIRGASERPTATLEGRYYMDVLSTMLRLATKNCSVDIQLHLGTCTDPSDFNEFKKAIIFEDAQITNYGTDDLGALASGDNAAVNENIDISAAKVYEVRPLTVSSVGGSIVTNEVMDIIFGDTKSCGDECETSSDGCSKVYALTKAAGGSPSTPADVVYILGTTVGAHDIDTLSAAEEADGIAVVGSYLVVVASAVAQYHYALKANVSNTADPVWTEVAVASAGPKAIWSLGNVAFLAGTLGYIWKMTSPVTALSVLTAGGAGTDTYNAVHALDADYAVAVGNSGQVSYTTNGSDWVAATRPTGAGVHLNCVFMASKKTWWVGSSTGKLFYTTDQGVTWTEKSFSGTGSGSVNDIKFSTGAIGYMAHSTGSVARMFRTYDGGYTWNLMPEDTGAFPTGTRINRIATCSYDANIVFGGGLGVDTDGMIVKGVAS